MERNVGIFDMVIRFFLLMAVVIAGVMLNFMPLAFLGVIFFITALTGWCPINQMIGRNTCEDI